MKPRLVVGVPNTGSVRIETTRSLIGLVGAVKGQFDLNYLFHGGCYVHRNRETLVKEAIEYKFTHLLFVDSDIAFNPEDVLKLLDQKKPIIGANYNERRLPPVSTVKIADSKGNLVGVEEKDFPKETFRCWALGTGFMLIDLSIMKRVLKPWFFFDTKEGEFNMGEDIWFCKQARMAGYDIWCDPTVKVAHVGDFYY